MRSLYVLRKFFKTGNKLRDFTDMPLDAHI